jgi:hypothetical protein
MELILMMKFLMRQASAIDKGRFIQTFGLNNLIETSVLQGIFSIASPYEMPFQDKSTTEK